MLKPGDRLRVTSPAGKKSGFVLAEVQLDALVARGGGRYLYRDIAKHERTHTSAGKTIVLVGVLLALTLAISYAVAVVSLAEGI